MSVTLALFEKNMIPNAHKLPRILSTLLVTVFTSFLILFLFNIFLFDNTLSSKVYVYFTFIFLIHFQMISNFLNIN